MRDIVLRFTESEAGVLLLMAEKFLHVFEEDSDEARKQTILPVAKSALAKLRKPLKRRKVL